MSGESGSSAEVWRDLDFAGFAQEFLRRNPDYRREHEALPHNSEGAAMVEQEVMARRWGLCFSLCAGCDADARARSLASLGIAGDCHPRYAAAQHGRRPADRHR